MKKTIIAASLTALAMGSVFAANTYKYNQAQGEPIKYNKDSATEGGKLTGGWYYDHAENVNANTNFDHSANSTDITLTGGTFDELIGGNHIKQPTYTESPKVTIGDTKVTMTDGSVGYFIGGSKANNSDKTTLITGDVTAVISGGSVTGAGMGINGAEKVSVVGGSCVKSTGYNNQGTPASTTAETGNISLSISGGTFTGAVFGGSIADNYGETQASDSAKPDLSIKTGVSSLLIEGGTFDSSEFGVFGGSAALGKQSSTVSSGSSVSIDAKKAVVITGRVVGGDLLGLGGSDDYATSSTINGSTSVSITGSGNITTTESVIGGSLLNLLEKDEESSSTISGTSEIVIDAANAVLGDEVIGGSYVRTQKDTGDASASVKGTSVTVKSGTIKGNVVGGGKVNGKNGTVESSVEGDTLISISGGTVTGAVIGGGHAKIGDGTSGDMSANVAGTSRIQITGGTVNGVIGGGLSYAYGTNGVDWKSTASVGKSEVIITGGTIEAVNDVATAPKQTLPVAIVGGGVSWSKDTISGENPPIELTTTTSSSSVVIDGATVKADIVGGGYAHQTGSTASVENASLSISNATLGSDSNKVNIYAGGVTSGDAVSSNVTAAQLQITATTVSGDVYTGGSGANSTVGTSSAALTDTTVSGALNFEGSDETSIVFAGVNSVGSVTGTAQSYAFNAADEQTAAVLTVKEGAIDLSEAKSIRAKAKAGQTLINGSVTTGEDTVVVVETPTGDFTYNVEAGTGDGMGITSGGLQIGESTISGKGEANTNSKTLSEAFLGSVAFVNQGAEFIADEGLNAAVRAAQGASGFTAFGAIHGGKSRYETGSHVDLRGTSLAAGAAGRVGGALIAGFVEAGWASSDSHVNGARGDADHDYYGVGAALRYDFSTPFYLEGSVRAGSASTDFDGAFGNASAHFESDAFYASAHLGGGYVFKLDPVQLDLYGRYTITYLDNDDTDIGTGYGETLSMSSATTHALRIGGRLTGDFSETTSWKVGAAYEHVFDGDAEADILFGGSAAALDVPSLSGNTGILELGLSVKPSASSPWTADIGVKGYVGDRRGAAGSISVLYAF